MWHSVGVAIRRGWWVFWQVTVKILTLREVVQEQPGRVPRKYERRGQPVQLESHAHAMEAGRCPFIARRSVTIGIELRLVGVSPSE